MVAKLEQPKTVKPEEVLIGFCDCGAIRVVSHGPTTEGDWNAHVSHAQTWGRYEVAEWRPLSAPTTEDGGEGE